MQEVEKLVKTMKDDKTNVNLDKSNLVTIENAEKRSEFDSEFGSKTELWLELTCRKCHLQYPEQYPVPYPDQKQTEYVDVLDGGWDIFKNQIKEMSKLAEFLTSSSLSSSIGSGSSPGPVRMDQKSQL